MKFAEVNSCGELWQNRKGFMLQGKKLARTLAYVLVVLCLPGASVIGESSREEESPNNFPRVHGQTQKRKSKVI